MNVGNGVAYFRIARRTGRGQPSGRTGKDDPNANYGDEDYGHQAYRNLVVYAPPDLLAWCRLHELNTNAYRALLDKSQHLGSAP